MHVKISMKGTLCGNQNSRIIVAAFKENHQIFSIESYLNLLFISNSLQNMNESPIYTSCTHSIT